MPMVVGEGSRHSRPLVRHLVDSNSMRSCALHDEVGDRGSDTCDCMIEFLDDDFDVGL